MELSEFIARLLGAGLIVVSATILLRRHLFLKIAKDFTENYASLFTVGLLTFIAGFLIIEFHNIWVYNWTAIITIIGWLAIIGGIFRMAFPDVIQKIITANEKNTIFLTFGAIISLALGLFLAAKGFHLLT